MSENNLNEILDADLKKAFNDLQKNKRTMIKRSFEMDAQIDHLVKLITFAELTYNEIKALPPATNVYNTMGRMFVQSDIDEVKSNINKEFQYAKTKIINVENNKQFLEFIVKEKADNLRSMVKVRKEKLNRVKQ